MVADEYPAGESPKQQQQEEQHERVAMGRKWTHWMNHSNVCSLGRTWTRGAGNISVGNGGNEREDAGDASSLPSC